MPLYRGLKEFEYDGVPYYSPHIDIFRSFNRKKEKLIAFFSDNSDLLINPYEVELVEGQRSRFREKFRVKKSCSLNKIFIMLSEENLLAAADGKDNTFYDWDYAVWFPGADVSFERKGYILIDFVLYYMFLINLYQPRADLIRNLYDVNVVKDVFGALDEHVALASITKIVVKVMGKREYETKDAYNRRAKSISRDILLILKVDVENKRFCTKNNGIDFEEKCKNALLGAGFDVKITPYTGDYGADILAYKDGLSYAIQCKDTSKPVGLKAIQEAAAARAHYVTDFAVVCATGGFTDAAIELATSNKVMVCLGEQLVARLSAI